MLMKFCITPNLRRQLFKCYFIFLVSFGSAFAQESDSTRVIIENGYIENMSDKIGLNLALNNSFETFEVNTESNRTVLYPNTPSSLRLNFNYRFISFSLQLSPDFLPGNGDEAEKGETKSFTLGTALILRHWFGDIAYSRVKGYYLKNTDDFIDFADGDPYIQFPDLIYKGFALRVGYKFNSQFSLRSLASQTERQLKSSGSFMPVLFFRYYTIDDQSDATVTQKSNNVETSVGPGYAYTFVLKENFYASIGVFGSVGYLNTHFKTRFDNGTVTSTQDNFILRWDTRGGIGYNGKKFYSGLFTNISGTSYDQENTTASNFETRVFYNLFFGIRLKAPRFLEKQANNLEKLVTKEKSE